tara:strand:+ start:950 stop:1051 length:102 start_codon:yes stop_codon:yes gene_type:complete
MIRKDELNKNLRPKKKLEFNPPSEESIKHARRE